jgi:adenylate kinase family enzyme
MDYVDVCFQRQAFLMNFWCNKDEIQMDQLDRFIETNKDKLHIRTVIKSTAELAVNDFIWYDIIRREDDNITYGDRRRFVKYYEKPDELIACLKEFSDCAAFCCGEKPKKQKRNDYESSDSRK